MTKAWKDMERRCARKAGTQRTGSTGMESEDWGTERFCFEGKHRKNLPDWIQEIMRAHDSNRDGVPIPVLVWHIGSRSIAMMNYDDLLEGESVEEICIEQRRRNRMPAWLARAFRQAQENAGERIPVVVLHKKYSPLYIAAVEFAYIADVLPQVRIPS